MPSQTRRQGGRGTGGGARRAAQQPTGWRRSGRRRRSSRRSAICCLPPPIWRASSRSTPRRRCAPPTRSSNGAFAPWNRWPRERGAVFSRSGSRRPGESLASRQAWRVSATPTSARREVRAAPRAHLQTRSRSADHARREAILRGAARRQVLIVAGDTGSGKSTQLPQYCLELGRGMRGSDRTYAAAATRGARAGRADRRGIGASRRAQRGIPGALRRPGVRGDAPACS